MEAIFFGNIIPFISEFVIFIDVYYLEVLLWLYIFLCILLWILLNRSRKEMRGATALLKTSKILLEIQEQIIWKCCKVKNKLKETLKEVRENRDKVYNKHRNQIYYYKKRFLALDLAIKENFKDAPHFIELLKNDFLQLQKKKFDELREIEKNLEKKKK